MNIIRKASHVLVCGMSGMGKTGYGERYIIGSHHGRVFIFDHQAEFFIRLNLRPVVKFEHIRRRAETERIVCYDYSYDFPGNLEDAFDLFCDEVFDLNKTYLEPQKVESLLVCDEIQKVCTPNECPQPLKNILQTGRRFNVDTLSLSQQPNRIHNEQRVQVTELVMFHLNDENSLKFTKNCGLDTEPIQRLKPLQYRWHNMLTGEVRTSTLDFPKLLKK